MGYILSHDNEGINIERRRESIVIIQPYEDQAVNGLDLFAYGSMLKEHGGRASSIEIDKNFLSLLLAFFDNPENRRLCDLEVPEPLSTAR